jgi:putative transposase
MLLRLGYLTVSNVFAMLRLLPMGDQDKDVEILALAPSDRGAGAPAGQAEAAVHPRRFSMRFVKR